VNKAAMVERIAELVREKKIDGIADLRDESDRQGYRVVVELKREAVPDVVLNQLYRFTPLQSSFSANIVALDGGRPLVMTLKDCSRPSSPSAKRSSPAVPNICSARRVTAPTCWSDLPSRWPISTSSSGSSVPPKIRRRRARP
jgi:hypothetical protein